MAATVYITQWLCPSRHSLLAAPWRDDLITREEVEEQGAAALRQLLGDKPPICDLCGSTEITVTHDRSLFQDYDLAVAACALLGIAQIAAKERLRPPGSQN